MRRIPYVRQPPSARIFCGVLELNSRIRIADLLRAQPAAEEALRAAGLDPTGFEEQTLGALCWQYGFNPGMLVMILQSAAAAPRLNVDTEALNALTLGQLADHIEQQHHAYLREEMRALETLVEQVAAAAGEDPSIAAVRDLFRSLSAGLADHLIREESVLFPMVRELDRHGAVTSTHCGGSAVGPVVCMEREHEGAAAALRRLRQLTNNYSLQAATSEQLRAMLQRLARFDQDLEEHMYKENELLFPRALEQERHARLREKRISGEAPW